MLAKDTSHTNQIWSVMMNRGEAHNYTLPAAKGREEFDPFVGVAPGPRPASEQDQGRLALLVKPDMLPTGVRACLRVFLHPPRPSITMKKSTKRKLESELAWTLPPLRRQRVLRSRFAHHDQTSHDRLWTVS
jgi:hypothetical protein